MLGRSASPFLTSKKTKTVSKTPTKSTMYRDTTVKQEKKNQDNNYLKPGIKPK